MPVVNGRLTCCTCGSDLGDAEDPYRDPGCLTCINRDAIAEAEAEDERARWDDGELREASLEESAAEEAERERETGCEGWRRAQDHDGLLAGAPVARDPFNGDET